MKYTIGVKDFEKIRRDNYVYVDKTDLVYKLAQEGKIYFLSRPRRFGKSLLLSTLEAYFLGKKELFRGLAMERLETEWETYPVLHLDLNIGKYNEKDALDGILDDFLAQQESIYGSVSSETTSALRFAGIIRRAAEKTGKKVVVLVDEYDKPLLQALGNDTQMEEYRSTLKAFYGVLKSADKYLRFSLLTGVTRFSKVSIFSDLNNLQDISIDSRYQTICGITYKEITTNFCNSLNQLANNLGVSRKQVHSMVKEMYGGYHFSPNETEMYNPLSLIKCFRDNKLGDFWLSDDSYTLLDKIISLSHKGIVKLPDLFEEFKSVDLQGYIDCKRNLMPILYQYGYLTIKDYNSTSNTYSLHIPNKEVKRCIMRKLLLHCDKTEDKTYLEYIGKFAHYTEESISEDFMLRIFSQIVQYNMNTYKQTLDRIITTIDIMTGNKKCKWANLRKKEEQANKPGFDSDYHIGRTCLRDYLKVIFPNDIWEHTSQLPYIMAKRVDADLTLSAKS